MRCVKTFMLICMLLCILASCSSDPQQTTPVSTAPLTDIDAPPEPANLMPLDPSDKFVLRAYYYEHYGDETLASVTEKQQHSDTFRGLTPGQTAKLSAILETMAGGQLADGVIFDPKGLPEVDECIYFKFSMNTVYDGTNRLVDIFFTPEYALMTISGEETIYKYPFNYSGLYNLAEILGLLPIEPKFFIPAAPEWEVGYLVSDIDNWDMSLTQQEWMRTGEQPMDTFDASQLALLKSALLQLTDGTEYTEEYERVKLDDDPYLVFNGRQGVYEQFNIIINFKAAYTGGDPHYTINIDIYPWRAVATIRDGDRLLSKLYYYNDPATEWFLTDTLLYGVMGEREPTLDNLQ